MSLLVCLLIIIALLVFLTYQYFKITINSILDKLVILDKIFEGRYNELSKAISQFQKYLPEEKSLIFDIQRAKVDVANFLKPKTTKELAQKIINENALTININYLLDKCDFNSVHPDLAEVLKIQADYVKKIDEVAQEYNKMITSYKEIKQIIPFKYYSKLIHIDLDLDTIKTY